MPLRIFISSPGDVIPERRRAQLVIDKLAKTYARSFAIEPILWEVEPMLASGHFQDQIVPPGETDIVVLIVWSRLGTPLPEKTDTRAYRGIDGRVPVTGTEWEFEHALAAQKQRGAPDLLAYRKRADRMVALQDEAAMAAAREQLRSLDAFWSRWFVDRGEFRAAFGDFTDLDAFEEKLERDLRALIERRIGAQRQAGQGEPAPIWHAGSPFRGLDSYRFEHAPIFFGRSAMTRAAVEQLTANGESGRAFLLILGASGAGKSSLAQAGVLPALVGRGIVPGVGLWRRAVMRPGGHAAGPFAALAEALAEATALPELLSGKQDVAALVRHFRASVDDPAFSIVATLDRIEEAARRQGDLLAIETARLALVVDQMEELFTGAEMTGEERTGFVRCLDGLARCGRVCVLATMRSDYWHRAAETPLVVEMAAGNGRLDLLPATQDEIIEMIRQPAEAAGLAFDSDSVREIGLDATLASEAASEPGALPLLSFLLDELYKRDIGDNRSTLTHASMHALGGLRGAIANRAEAAFADLPADVQAALPRMLRALVTVSRAGAEPTARPATMAQFANESPERRLVEALVAARLLVVDGDRADVRVRLAHEALITHWKRARDQIAQDRDDLRTRAMIEHALAEYRAAPAGRQGNHLLRDPQLASAVDLTMRWSGDFDAETLSFIQASRRRARWLQQLTAAAAAVFAAVAIFAGVQYYNAEAAKRQADRQRNDAERNLAVAQTTQSLFLADLARQRREAGDDSAAILLAIEALPGGSAAAARPYVPQAELQLDVARRSLRERRILAGHGDSVHSAAFSPDGKRIVTASKDKTARLWDAETGRQIGALVGHEGEVTGAAFSPDGKRIVTGSDDKTARLWDAETGRQTGALIGHEDSVRSVAFSRDGKRIVTASFDRTARLWDAETGRQIGAPLGHEGVLSAAFSPDGKRIVTTSGDKTVRLWDAETGRQIGELIGHEGPVTSAAFSPDGKRIVTASADTTARLWDAETGRQIGALVGHQDSAWNAAFSPDGKRVVTASSDKTARLWDAETGRQIGALVGHEASIWSAAFSPDGKRIVTASDDKTARLWDVESDGQIGALVGHDGEVTSAGFSRDSKRIVTASSDKTVRLWDAATGRQVGALVGHEDEVTSAAFSPDGRRIVTASKDKTVRLWDAATGRQIGALVGHELPVTSAAFSPDGRRIVTASDDKTARLWDAATGRQIGAPLVHEDVVLSAAFSPDGKRIVTALSDKTVRLWDAETGRLIGALVHDGWIESAAFSPDGKRIVTGSDDSTARLWDVETGRQIGAFVGHEGGVTSAAFSPDGKRIVTASSDKTARLWDAETGRQIGALVGHEDVVWSAAFSPDGKRIVTASKDKSARLWDAFPTTQELLAAAKAVLPRCLTAEQRRAYFLPAEPAEWCIEMEKWPFQSQDWKDWLKFKRASADPPLPDSAEWKDWIAARR